MERAFEGIVFGDVQGVGFRYFALEQARDLGVQGWVRNLPDGTVGFHGEGPSESVEEWIRHLKQGPVSGRVDRLTGDWLPSAEGHLRFEIKG